MPCVLMCLLEIHSCLMHGSGNWEWGMRVLRKHIGNELGGPVRYRVRIGVQQRPNAEDGTVQSSDGGRVERVTTWRDLRLTRKTNEPIL